MRGGFVGRHERSRRRTRAAAPIENTPTTTSPTPTCPAYAPDDPATWTISGDEVGPVALGGDRTAETDDLAGAYAEEPTSACPNPDVSVFRPDDGPVLTVTTRNGKVDGGYSITFELGADDVHVGMVWVSSDPVPPSEFCG